MLDPIWTLDLDYTVFSDWYFIGQYCRLFDHVTVGNMSNRPFSYSTKEPGSSVIFIQFYTQGSIEWR